MFFQLVRQNQFPDTVQCPMSRVVFKVHFGSFNFPPPQITLAPASPRKVLKRSEATMLINSDSLQSCLSTHFRFSLLSFSTRMVYILFPWREWWWSSWSPSSPGTTVDDPGWCEEVCGWLFHLSHPLLQQPPWHWRVPHCASSNPTPNPTQSPPRPPIQPCPSMFHPSFYLLHIRIFFVSWITLKMWRSLIL